MQPAIRVVAFLPERVRRVVAEVVVLDQVVHHVDPEAVDAAVQPEAQDVQHRLLHFGVAPVEVGLLAEEGVVVVLPGVSRPTSRRCRRSWRASCSAASRPASRRARCTSRASGCRGRSAIRGTRGAGRRCGSARSRGSASCRAGASLRAGGRSRPACRRAGRCRGSRRRRSRSPSSASGRTARSRSRRRRATSGSRGGW